MAKFWELQGSTLKIPLVERRALDLYTLKKYVQKEGGMELVNSEKKWTKVASDMGYSINYNKHIGALLKAHYERIIYPLDIFEREEQKKTQVKEEAEEVKEEEKEYKPHNIPSRMGMKPPADKDKAGRRSQRFNDEEIKKEEDGTTNSFSKELARLQFFGAGPKMAGLPSDQTAKEKTRGMKLNFEYDPVSWTLITWVIYSSFSNCPLFTVGQIHVSDVRQGRRGGTDVVVRRLRRFLPHLLPDASVGGNPQRRLALPQMRGSRSVQAAGSVRLRTSAKRVHVADVRRDGRPVQVGLLQHAGPLDSHVVGRKGVLEDLGKHWRGRDGGIRGGSAHHGSRLGFPHLRIQKLVPRGRMLRQIRLELKPVAGGQQLDLESHRHGHQRDESAVALRRHVLFHVLLAHRRSLDAFHQLFALGRAQDVVRHSGKVRRKGRRGHEGIGQGTFQRATRSLASHCYHHEPQRVASKFS